MAYSNVPDESVFMRGGAPFARMYDATRPPDAEEYSASLDQPGSYVSGLYEVMNSQNSMIVAASAGDLARAKAHYDSINQFFLDHQDDTAKAVSMDPGRDRFLNTVWAAANDGKSRKFDNIQLKTPYGVISAGDLFGPGDKYKEWQAEQLTRLRFSKSVADLVSGTTPDVLDPGRTEGGLKSIVEGLVNHVVDAYAAGQSVRSPDQYAALADCVAQSGAKYITGVGAEAVSATVNSLTSRHMDDGTAVAMFKWTMDQLAARKAAASAANKAFNPSQEAYALINAYEGMVREAVPRGEQIPGNLSRWMSLNAMALVADDPGVDFNDFGVRQAVMEVANVTAMADRAGVKFLPEAQSAGVDFKKSFSGYIMSRRQGWKAPHNNYVRFMTGLHSMLGRLIAPGWTPTSDATRADPTKEVGKASGVFRATSGSEGLDNAAVELYASMARGALRHSESLNEVEALSSYLSEPGAIDEMADDLSVALSLPAPAARMVVSNFVRDMKQGENAFIGQGLERAIAAAAFGTGMTDATSRQLLAKWYAANVGPNGRYYDQLLQDAGWERILRDDVLGYGEMPARQAEAVIANMKQKFRMEAQEVAEKGVSPVMLMEGRRHMGRYWAVTGLRYPNGQPVDIKETKEGLFYKNSSGKYTPLIDKDGFIADDRLVPVFSEGFGNLDKVAQPYKFKDPRLQIPVFEAGLFNQSFDRFRSYMKALKDMHSAQQKAAKDVFNLEED